MSAATLITLVMTSAAFIYYVESSDGRPNKNLFFTVPTVRTGGSSSSNQRGKALVESCETPTQTKYAQQVAAYRARKKAEGGNACGDDQPAMDLRSRVPKRLHSHDQELEELKRKLQEINSAEAQLMERATSGSKSRSSNEVLQTLKVNKQQTIRLIKEREKLLKTLERQQEEAEGQPPPQQRFYQQGPQQNYPPNYDAPAYPPNFYPPGYNQQQFPQYPPPGPYGPPSDYMDPRYQNYPRDPRNRQ